MKNVWKKLVALIVAATALISCTACSQESQVINAYDIAVKNGFVGTEQDWLLSLKGANGEDGDDLDINDLYEAAKEDGFEGTLMEFIQSLSVSVQENNATNIISQNLTSVVSITCGFIQTTVTGTYFPKEEKKVGGSEGSGVVVHLEKNRGVAYIVTNYHVVYNVNSDDGISPYIWIYPYGARDTFTKGDIDNGVPPGDATNGDGIRATFIGGAMDYDIALLQVNSEEIKTSVLTEARVGDSNSVTVGEKTFVIGNARGRGLSATSGILSVDSENIAMKSSDTLRDVTYRVMRTDAPINNGNSGGGLFNAEGDLIGIINAKTITENTDAMGYALPITQVKYVLRNIWDHKTATTAGYVARAVMGIETYIQHSKAVLSSDNKLKIEEEFLVSKVFTQGAVGKGNPTAFKVGDLFVSMTHNGVTTKLTRRYLFNDLLLNVRKGDTVVFTVLREGAYSGKTQVQVPITFDKDEYFSIFA